MPTSLHPAATGVPLERIFHEAGVYAWHYTVADGTFRVEEAFWEAMGVPAPERPESLAEFSVRLHPDDRAGDVASFTAMIEDRAERYDHQARYHSADGDYHWFHMRGAVMTRDESGAPVTAAGVLQNEQESGRRDRLMLAVQDVSQLLLGLDSEDSADVIWRALDALGRASEVDRVYIWQNHLDENGVLLTTQVEEWSPGAPPQQGGALTVAMPFAEACSGWDTIFFDNRCVNNIVRLMSTAEQAQLAPQGIISICVAPIFHAGALWGFIGFDDCHRERRWTPAEESLLKSAGMLLGASIVRDKARRDREAALVQAREYARRAETAAKAKEDFLARISGEIHGPMRDVLLAARQLAAGDFSDTQQEYLSIIRQRSQAIERLVGDLNDYSLIESGRIALAAERFDLEAAIEGACEDIARAAQAKGLDFSIHIPDGLPTEVVGDPHRIVQVLGALVDNAVHFTEHGEVVVQVVSAPFEDGRAGARIAVMDTGPGLSAELADLGNAPLNDDTDIQPVRRADGIGFGLALVRLLTRLAGGTMGVLTEERVGTTIWVHWPAPAAEGAPPRARFDGHALVVDGHANSAEALRMALEKYGVRADAAHDEAEGLARWAEADASPDPYTVVFMDAAFIHDRADGLMRAIAREARKPHARRILTLPFADRDLAVGFARLGYSAVLFKPVRGSQLQEIISAGASTGDSGKLPAREGPA